jgi:hypothetical protein
MTTYSITSAFLPKDIPAAQSLDGVAPNVNTSCAPALDRGCIITVVRTKRKPLGKKFDLLPDGSVRKESMVKMGMAVAVMRHVPTFESFAALLKEVSEDPKRLRIWSGSCAVRPRCTPRVQALSTATR